MASANTTVPMPTVPPSSQPTASTVISIAGPDQPDRAAGAPGQPGHQPVARAGAEVRADVHAGRHTAQQHAGDHVGDPPRQQVHVRQPLSEAFIDTPISTTLLTVPRPGRCRSGIQAAARWRPP